MQPYRSVPVATPRGALLWVVLATACGVPGCGSRTSLRELSEARAVEPGESNTEGTGGGTAAEVIASSADPSSGGSRAWMRTTTFRSDTRFDAAGGSPGTGGTTTSFSSAGINVSAVVMGYSHTCSLVDGALYCWGRNDEGQLGNGSREDASTPVRVGAISPGVTAVAAAGSHTCALFRQRVYCWGQNRNGELGNASTASSDLPVPVDGLYEPNAISTGVRSSCAAGSVSAHCWGDFFIETDSRTASDSLVPTEILRLPKGATALASGAMHACVLANGAVRCLGSNRFGQLGDGTTTDSSEGVQVSGLESGVTAIAAGVWHSCAVVNGSARCWGRNIDGQLGNGTTESSSTPVQVEGLTSGVTVLDASAVSTCGIRNGKMLCWGGNGKGQLGNWTTNASSTPVQVRGLSANVTAIATSGEHTCAVLQSTAVYCWGANEFGQLGNGTNTNSLVPVLAKLR